MHKNTTFYIINNKNNYIKKHKTQTWEIYLSKVISWKNRKEKQQYETPSYHNQIING